MTKRDYLKHNWEVNDMQGNIIKPGDTVVVNNHYASSPIVGIADHMTESEKLAIIYTVPQTLHSGTSYPMDCWAYRSPKRVIKIKDGNKSNNKN